MESTHLTEASKALHVHVGQMQEEIGKIITELPDNESLEAAAAVSAILAMSLQGVTMAALSIAHELAALRYSIKVKE